VIRLRGSTWNHTRGYAPLVATAKSYQLTHPEVEIHWDKRSLQDFADFPVETLAETYDLVMIDHPSVGTCELKRCFVPLDELLPARTLETLARQSVGSSHLSYSYNGHHWALAIDAASHVSAYRPDLLQRQNLTVPRSWEQVVNLAQVLHRSGETPMAVPLIPVDSLMCFYTLCASAGEDPFSLDDQRVVSRETGLRVLDLMRQVLPLLHSECFNWNPIQILDRMSSTDDVSYCPWLFGYSNYARPRYASFQCQFTNIPTLSGGLSKGAILGGAGLAVTSKCANPSVAADYASFVANAECQRSIYFESGGQPGNIEAWRDPAVNRASNGFFLNTLETLSHSYVRPCYPGYIHFQTQAGLLVHQYLKIGGQAGHLLEELDHLHCVTRNSVHLIERK
jgi:multiple sugar transport system substrate-binding protein